MSYEGVLYTHVSSHSGDRVNNGRGGPDKRHRKVRQTFEPLEEPIQDIVTEREKIALDKYWALSFEISSGFKKWLLSTVAYARAGPARTRYFTG